jgi:hypothetical protein
LINHALGLTLVPTSERIDKIHHKDGIYPLKLVGYRLFHRFLEVGYEKEAYFDGNAPKLG